MEGEIGTIGVMSNSDEGGVENVTYTNPEDVIDFVTKTGVDCLAIAIGTAHGIYPKGFVPKLQLELLERIKVSLLYRWFFTEEATIQIMRSAEHARSEYVK